MTKSMKMAQIANVVERELRAWQVGDACANYKLNAVTKIVRIDGAIVHLENGDSMHISKVRSVAVVR